MSKSLETEGGEEAAFNEAYASLNAAQRQAVDAIEGPVMVIAGPGTGKTQVLTLRIANILLRTDVQPENILALTFTESGATAMRNRLRRYIGAAAYRVAIHTFHGFAGQLIGQYPDAFVKIIGGSPATDINKIDIIQSIIDSSGVKLLRPMGNPAYYVTPVLRELGNLKQEYITPDRLAELISDQAADLLDTPKLHEKGAHKGKVRSEYAKKKKSIEKNTELLTVYRLYEAALAERNLYDFGDMLIEAVEALQKNEDMLRDLQETYQYVLADEHQDVNGTQNTLLELLVSYHETPNIFAVGDEKQAIYRFQGASLENFLYFEQRFPGTTTIALTDNYRSGQLILNAAHALVAVEDGPLKDLRVLLTAFEGASAVVERREFAHQAIEDTAVVTRVTTLLDAGVPPEEVAVIVRTNREVESLTELLRQAGHLVTPSADGDILNHPITTSVIELLEAITKPESNAALFGLLHAPYWEIPVGDLIKVVGAQSYDQPLSSIVASIDIQTEFKLIKLESLVRLRDTLEEARRSLITTAPHRLLEQVLQTSGFLDHVLELDPIEGVRILRRLYDEIETMVGKGDTKTLVDVLLALKQSQAYGLPLNAPYITTDQAAVQVMTAHKSKGLEFTAVLMPHLTDNLWGGAVRRKNFAIKTTRLVKETDLDPGDDERRLLFVGMTRAKTQLFLSSSMQNSEGKELTASRLLADIDESQYELVDTKEQTEKYQVADSLSRPSPKVLPNQDLFVELLRQRGFSATSINNYLRSPYDYIYRNLLRIPETQPVHMQFGTVVHNVLQSVTEFHTKKQDWPNTSLIKGWLECELGKLPITIEEYARLHEKGLTSTLNYLSHLQNTVTSSTREELSVNVVMQTGLEEFPEITLKGKLDRLDLDDSGQAIRVVDYKTGKAKSRNDIEGKTKNSGGDYKRQLVFYALLLQLHGDDRYQTRTGTLSFVEADARGVIKEESFTITDEEIAELQQEIITAVKDIISGVWLENPCDESESSYCHLVRNWLV